MIHARIIDNVAEDERGAITDALLGRTPKPVVPAAMQGARLPPIGVPVRTLPGASLAQSMAELRAAMPRGGRRG